MHAKDSRNSLDFTFLDFKRYGFDVPLSKAVVQELSRGRTVIVKNYPVLSEPKDVFDLQYLDQEMQLTGGRELCVQGKFAVKYTSLYSRWIDAVARTKSWTEPFAQTDGKTFCDDIDVPEKVQALLDFPLPDGNVPGFIS